MKVSDHYVTAWDREWFKRCRRAWDLGSHDRRDLEPLEDRRKPDLTRAIREALAVYYYPGMWDWKPMIVRPLVLEGYRRSIGRDLAPELFEAGEGMLQRYFEWAPTVDHFCPLQVSAELVVGVPDPSNPGVDLVAPDGRGVHYKDRLDGAVMDEQGFYWLLQHRLVEGEWGDLDLLTLGPRMLAACWAAETFYLAPVAGVILNELRVPRDGGGDAINGQGGPVRRREVDMRRGSVLQSRHRPQLARSGLEPVGVQWHQETTPWFRRTHMPVRRDLIESQGGVIAHEVLDIVADGLRLYPNPGPQNCSGCAFRAPCLAMLDGADAEPMLTARYRHRPPSIEEPRIGRGFGYVVPPRPAQPRTISRQP